MSKGLKALENLWYGQKTTENYEIIEKELKDFERLKTSYLENLLNEQSKEYIYKKLKALEIIKNKCEIELGEENGSYYLHIDYDYGYDLGSVYIELTKKEYDLLREVLL